MTLEQYYKAVENLKHNEPKNASWFEIGDYYNTETEKLRSNLSEKDLEAVLEDQRRWERKMQSPYN